MAFINSVVLIDDDEIFNLVTENLIKLYDFADQVITFQSAAEALSFLKGLSNKKEAYPEVIFLDVNMPITDGWGFLDIYRQFPEEVKSQAQLYMLSSSLDEFDVLKSKQYEDVYDFIQKPLLKMNLEVIKFRIESE